MSLASKSFSLFKRDVFLFVCRLLASVVIARKLGPETMGVFLIIMLIPGYAESLGRLKFDIAAVYFLGKKRTSLGEMIFTTNLLALISVSLVISIFLVNFDWFYGHLFSSSAVSVAPLVYLSLILTVLRFLQTNNLKLHTYREDVTAINRVIVLEAILGSGGAILLLLFFEASIMLVLLAQMVGIAVSLFYSMLLLLRVTPITPSFNLALIKDMARYSWHLYVGGAIAHLQAYLTNLLSALYLSAAQMAFFGLAKDRALLLMTKVPTALNVLLFPRIAKADNIQSSAMLLARAFRVTLVILLVTGACLALLIKPLVLILYGQEYLPMVKPFLIVLPALVLSESASVTVQFFSGIGRAELIPRTLILPVIIQALLAYYLMPIFGVSGAALAFASGSILLALIQLALFIRVAPCTLHDIMLRKEDFQTVWQFIRKEAVGLRKFIKTPTKQCSKR